jgi:hydrogenase maturation protease
LWDWIFYPFALGCDLVDTKVITILGIGCALLADQGFGVSVVQALDARYQFPENVQLLDGGLLGVVLTGTIAQANHLIVIDSIANCGRPGDIYRLEDQEIRQRLTRKKNPVYQVEFLEALVHCQSLDAPPQTVLLAVEPADTQTLACALTPVLQDKIDPMVALVLKELDQLGVSYGNKKTESLSCA